MSLALVEELWFGDHSDEGAEHAAAASMAAVAAQVVGLRPFPIATRRLLGLIAHPEFTMQAVTSVIESDPPLAARVLRTVNSAAYFLPHRVASVGRAVTLLGARTVGDIATAMMVLQMFEDGPGLPARIRQHSSVVAAIARFLALQRGVPAEDVFTCGLLHDVGKLLLLQAKAKDYRALLDGAEKQRDATYLAEREQLGFDHAVLAGQVMQAWGLPPPIPMVVAWHHQPARAYAEGGGVAELVSLVRLADRLSYDLEALPQPDADLLAAVGSDEAASYLRLSPEDLAAMWDDLQVVRLEGQQLAAPGLPTVPSLGFKPRGRNGLSFRRCSQCERRAARAKCKRCARPVCPEHRPAKDARCGECESEFRQQLATLNDRQTATRRLRGAGVAAALLPTLVVMAVFVPPLRWLSPLWGTVLAALLAAPLLARHQVRRARAAFLAERFARRDPDEDPSGR